jgi:hypothetical protein
MLGADEFCKSAPWNPGQESWGPVCLHPHVADMYAEAIDDDEPPPDWCPLRLTSSDRAPRVEQAEPPQAQSRSAARKP